MTPLRLPRLLPALRHPPSAPRRLRARPGPGRCGARVGHRRDGRKEKARRVPAGGLCRASAHLRSRIAKVSISWSSHIFHRITPIRF